MKKITGIVIALLAVMAVGCSNINSEQQENNGITQEQQTEEENQSIQSTEIVRENEVPIVTDNIADYSE